MITVSHHAGARSRAGALLALTALTITATVSACGSGGHTAPSGPPAAAQAACRQVSAVLSDGPDPDADPVGYAEAQVLPLRQIHTSDQILSRAISTLAGAYSSYYTADGASSAAKAALTAAANRINWLCPGAGATA